MPKVTTFRELLATMTKFMVENPNHEALDRDVVVRVQTEDGLAVGGLRSVEVDAGCTEEHALVLDASQGDD